MDCAKIIQNVKEASNWEKSLRDGNDLLHFGSAKFEDAVKRYCKILELLLRYLHKEIIPALRIKERNDILQAEFEAGQDKPFEEFTFGQEIAVFSKSSLLEFVNTNLISANILDATKLRNLNNLRKEVTHHDESTATSDIDNAREYVTNVLLALRLIDEDPEKPRKIPRGSTELAAKKKRLANLRDVVRTIRVGLIEKAHFEVWLEMEKDYGWHAQASIKGEIIGAYLASDETFSVVINVLDCEGPEMDEPTEIYEHPLRKSTILF